VPFAPAPAPPPPPPTPETPDPPPPVFPKPINAGETVPERSVMFP
jgi:hypothetical protein